MVYNVEQLKKAVRSGNTFRYVLFYGHYKDGDQVTKNCLSNWWEQSFTVNGITYAHTEQYMMAEKARLFNDTEVEKMIMATKSQGKAKSLGRSVRGFDRTIWDKHCFDIVVEGNYHKFSQNKELKEFLLNTGDAILVEASPTDTIWGIGLSVRDDRARRPLMWKGTNLLGFALMVVRDRLRSEQNK